MAGTLFGLGLMPQFDTTGVIARGALLYIYDAQTSTPANTFADFDLTSLQSWPIQADSGGRLPQFWLTDGAYRARLTTSGGVEIFDEQSITTIGPSSGLSGGSAQDSSVVFQTGYWLWDPVQTTITGFVRGNGLTIGNASSSGTERANGDTQALFEYFWNNFSDSECPVSTGRGGSAVSDFNANKTIGTFNMRDCVAIGRSGMGNTSTGLISDTLAASVGATTRTLVQANLPSVNFSVSATGSCADHTHSGVTGTMNSNTSHSHSFTNSNFNNVNRSSGGSGTNQGSNGDNTGSTNIDHTHSFTTGGANSALSVSVTGTAASGGSGTAVSTIPKGRVGNWFVKL